MAQTKILVDSCCYFRLAQNIHPLLSVSFGAAAYTLYAHAALTAEFSRSPRLQTKFEWVMRPEYQANRARPLQIGRSEAKAITETFEYIWEHVKAENLGASRVDVQILATAAELNIRMVTDDRVLLDLARQYGVHYMSSLELMCLMRDQGHITIEKVRQVVAQWQYDNDLPENFRAEYQQRFGEKPPRE